ncbi:Hypothetical predicted protein [Mytilus galloprovincialis]|uniref:Uncharacterized protein n=1 Tax=Mytilus galloprovincialis TaxID=29158 RepID=A0A8B6DG98_MYTGA|nr:Hypothetical predicted protein [Mytilus galloprovincialis]
MRTLLTGAWSLAIPVAGTLMINFRLFECEEYKCFDVWCVLNMYNKDGHVPPV